jgi:hypothetical protein
VVTAGGTNPDASLVGGAADGDPTASRCPDCPYSTHQTQNEVPHLHRWLVKVLRTPEQQASWDTKCQQLPAALSVGLGTTTGW